MDNNFKNRNFLEYLNSPISKEAIDFIYKTNSIRFEKCDLYVDYIKSLLMIVFDTYMGDEVTDIKEQEKHFNWCYLKNQENFVKEGLLFNSDELYDYFYGFTLDFFYNSPEKNEDINFNKSLISILTNIFEYDRLKTRSDVDIMLEIYKIIDLSLKTI